MGQSLTLKSKESNLDKYTKIKITALFTVFCQMLGLTYCCGTLEKTWVEEGLLLRTNCGWPARQPRWKLRPFGHFGHLGLLAVAGWIIKVMRRHNCYLKMMCGQKKLLNTLFVYVGIKNSVILRYQRLAV